MQKNELETLEQKTETQPTSPLSEVKPTAPLVTTTTPLGKKQQVLPPIARPEETIKSRRLHSVPTTQERAQLAALEAKRRAEAHRTKRRTGKPLIRRLEEALNGGDSVHEPYANLFETLTICLNSGMGLPDALRLAAQRAPAEVARICEDVAKQTEAGTPLHVALRRWQAQLPEVVIPLLEHGVQYSSLGVVTRQVTRTLKHFAELDRKFAYSALNSDMVVPILLCGTMPFMPLLIENPAIFAAYCLSCMAISGVVWVNRHKLNRQRVKTVLGLAPTRRGETNRRLSTARWAHTLSALYDCGVPISSALEAAALAARNHYYARALMKAARLTREGKTLAESLAAVRLLPSNLVETIRTGETAGELAPLLERFADRMDDDAKMLAAQRFGMQIIAGLMMVATVAVMYLMMAFHMPPWDVLKIGAGMFCGVMLLFWFCMLFSANNKL